MLIRIRNGDQNDTGNCMGSNIVDNGILFEGTTGIIEPTNNYRTVSRSVTTTDVILQRGLTGETEAKERMSSCGDPSTSEEITTTDTIATTGISVSSTSIPINSKPAVSFAKKH